VKLLAFSVYDAKAEAYLRPYFADTKGLAMRAFRDAVNDPQHEMHRHAEDYTLFAVGEFDVMTGMFTPYLAPIAMATAITLREVNP